MAWSPDGRLVTSTGTGGAGTWRAEDGSPVQLRCGIWFERSELPPMQTLVNQLDEPLCE